MLSKTRLANMALRHLAVSTTIANVETDKTPHAKACQDFYDAALDQVLRDWRWPFATKIQALGLVEEEPNDEWGFSYRYPSDCVDFRRIQSGAARVDSRATQVKYRLGADDSGELIFTDQPDAVGEWTFRHVDVAHYPADFGVALSYLLASLIAPSVTAGDQFKLGARALSLYQVAIAGARANAANEEARDEPPESSFVSVRG